MPPPVTLEVQFPFWSSSGQNCKIATNLRTRWGASSLKPDQSIVTKLSLTAQWDGEPGPVWFCRRHPANRQTLQKRAPSTLERRTLQRSGQPGRQSNLGGWTVSPVILPKVLTLAVFLRQNLKIEGNKPGGAAYSNWALREW